LLTSRIVVLAHISPLVSSEVHALRSIPSKVHSPTLHALEEVLKVGWEVLGHIIFVLLLEIWLLLLLLLLLLGIEVLLEVSLLLILHILLLVLVSG